MEQYVVHRGMHCQVVEHGWRYKVWKSSETGQVEHTIWKRRHYIPMGDYDDPTSFADPPLDQTGTELEKERQERARLLALEKSARRAKQSCSHKIKEAGFSSLLTCTYRENMTDFDRMRSDWAKLLRKLQAIFPGFATVYGFEQQERGAWHVHAAIHKLPVYLWVPQGQGSSRKVMVRSWDYIRRLWRAIVGQGNIDVDGHRRRRRSSRGQHSLAVLASYVSKYLTKDHQHGPAGRNRWGSTQGIAVSKPIVLDLPEAPLQDLIDLAFHLPDGHRIVRHRISDFGRLWLLHTEPGESLHDPRPSEI